MGSWPLEVPSALKGLWREIQNFEFFANINNMVVYGLPWTQAIKIIHFELTWDIKDSEDTEGVRRSISFFVQNSYTMVSSLRTPLEPSNHFELTLDPIDTENAKGVQRSFCIFCSKPF